MGGTFPTINLPDPGSEPSDRRPIASVIVPTWNRPRLLRRTLDALQRQVGCEPFEVLIVENGTACTPLLKSVYPDFRFYSLPKRGVCAARNLGTRLARSSLLIFVDDDIIPCDIFVAVH